MANDITYKQVEDFCKKRNLAMVPYETMQALRLGFCDGAPEQFEYEIKTTYQARNRKLENKNALLVANVQNLETEVGRLRFRYDNMKQLLNQFIATGLMPGYFDIYEKLKATEIKLKEARKEAAAANKRYKQLKKEFSRYRNEHVDSDCNGHIQELKREVDLYKSQIAALELNFEEYKKTHPEQFVESECKNCSFSYIDVAYDGTDVMYCRANPDEHVYVYDTHSCPKFKPKEEN